MKKLSLYLLLAVGLVACNQNKEATNPDIIQKADTLTVNERWVWPDSIVDPLAEVDSIISASQTPIDLKDVYTPEQKKLLKLLMTTFLDNVAFSGDSMYLSISRSDFVAKGIPEPYYDKLRQDLRDMNSFNASDPEMKGKVKELWEKNIPNLKKELEVSD